MLSILTPCSCNCDGVFGQVVSPKDTPRHGCHASAHPVSVWLCLLSIIGLNSKKIHKEIRIIHSLIIHVNNFLFPVSHYARKALAVSLSLRINRIFFYPDSERMIDSFALALFSPARMPRSEQRLLDKSNAENKTKEVERFSYEKNLFYTADVCAPDFFTRAIKHARANSAPCNDSCHNHRCNRRSA